MSECDDLQQVIVNECECDECVLDPLDQTIAWTDRVKRWDYIIVYGLILIVAGVFLLSYLPGIYSNWYATLKQPNLNLWVPRVLWVVATGISYIGLYILWREATPRTVQKYLSISVLYLIASFITVAWSVAFLQGENLELGTWIAGILFVYQFWVFIVIWYIKPLAAIFIIPLLGMYLYLVYSMAHLASLNGVGF